MSNTGIGYVLPQLARTALVPTPGCRFVVSDFSAIEARVSAWIAGETWKLEAFNRGDDIYCATASQMYGVPVEKHGANKELRARGKVAELACGYGGGLNAMKAMDTTGTLTDDTLENAKNKWRAANPHIVDMWGVYERAAVLAIRDGRTTETRQGITFAAEVRCGSRILFITLPSGRRLVYWGARYAPDPERPGRRVITYSGRGKVVTRAGRRAVIEAGDEGEGGEVIEWAELRTWGGKLYENVVQATARDILAGVLVRVTNELHYPIVMHIHDELVAEVPREEAQDALDKINAIMAEPPKWAQGLPLKGDGYTADFYRKD